MLELYLYLAYLWIFSCLILWTWHGIRYRRVNKLLKGESPLAEAINAEPLSLIICAHNEASNLKRLIPAWCEQDFENYEVLVVDDHSDDDSELIVSQAMNQYAHLRWLETPLNKPRGKKAALRRGIEAAQYENLVFCDADCLPATNQWLRRTADQLLKGEVVLGYGALRGEGFVAQLSDYETLSTAFRYWSYALIGSAYMVVGRNLAYRKSSMSAPQSLAKHADLLSGDDDLTLKEMSGDLKVNCMVAPETFTYSEAAPNLKSWWRQKGRHYSTAWRYANAIKLSLGVEAAFQLIFVLLLPLAIWQLPIALFLPLFLGRWFLSGFPKKAQWPLIQQKRQAWFWPFYEMFWAIAATLLHLRNLVFGPPKKW